MPLKPPPSAPVFEKMTPGLYPAILTGVMYLGELTRKKDDGSITGAPNLRLEFELPTIVAEKNDKKFTKQIGEDYFFYWANKKGEKSPLAQVCENIAGRELTEDVDMYELLGLSCQVNIVVNDKGYENIRGVMPWTDAPLIPTRELLRFDFDEHFGNYVLLPNFLKNKIATAPNFPKQHSQGKQQQGDPQQQQSAKPGEEIPF